VPYVLPILLMPRTGQLALHQLSIACMACTQQSGAATYPQFQPLVTRDPVYVVRRALLPRESRHAIFNDCYIATRPRYGCIGGWRGEACCTGGVAVEARPGWASH
jgi:hypothetical protein